MSQFPVHGFMGLYARGLYIDVMMPVLLRVFTLGEGGLCYLSNIYLITGYPVCTEKY